MDNNQKSNVIPSKASVLYPDLIFSLMVARAKCFVVLRVGWLSFLIVYGGSRIQGASHEDATV